MGNIPKNGEQLLNNGNQNNKSGSKPFIRKINVNYTSIPNRIHKSQTIANINEQIGFGQSGLRNLGNTCYMNCILQCLSNIQPLSDYLLNDLHLQEINYKNALGSKGKIVTAFAEIIKNIWTTKNEVINPQKFHNAFCEQFENAIIFQILFKKIKTIYDICKFQQFGFSTQEDAHEFLSFLLDIIHEDLNRITSKPYTIQSDYTQSDYALYAKDSWMHHLTRNKSIIVDLFQGQLKSTLTCKQCTSKSHRFDPFMYLSLPLQNLTKNKLVPLKACIQEFTKVESLEQNELWHCPKCKKKVNSSKKIDIYKAPDILIIHLKRFRCQKGRYQKINLFVDFPIYSLNLSEFQMYQSTDAPVYDLFAIAYHSGQYGNGHYFAACKNKIDKQWYLYNDSQIFKINDPEELKSQEAYILFYSKKVEYFRRQTLSRLNTLTQQQIQKTNGEQGFQQYLDEQNKIHQQ